MPNFLVSLFLAAGLTLAGLAMATDTGKEQRSPRSRKTAAGSEIIRSIAEVLAVDMTTRVVTLKRDDGNTLTVVASPQVKSLAQIKAGDFVIAEYGRARALSVKKIQGLRSTTTQGDGGTARTGIKQAAGSPRRLSIVADIIAIDDKKGLATVKGPKGGVVDVLVKDPKVLAAVKIGDEVELEYTEATAIAIRPAKSRR